MSSCRNEKGGLFGSLLVVGGGGGIDSALRASPCGPFRFAAYRLSNPDFLLTRVLSPHISVKEKAAPMGRPLLLLWWRWRD